MIKGYSTNKKILVFLFFIIFSFMFLNTNLVNANENKVDSSFYSNVKNIVAEQKFNVIFNIRPSKNIEKGINAYKAQLVYDSDVFEKIKEEDFSTLSGWEMLEYNENTGEFVLINKKGVTEYQDIFDLNITVKSSVNDIVEDLESKIILKDVVVSEGKEDIEMKKATVSVNVSPKQESSNNSTNSIVKPVNSTNFTNNSDSDVIGSKEDNTSKNYIDKDEDEDDDSKRQKYEDDDDDDNDNEKVGGFKHIISIILIILAVICFILLFLILIFKLSDDEDKNNNNKFEKEFGKKYNKIKVLSFIIGIIILSVFVVYPVEAAIYDYKNKGDVNGDKEINYDDVKLMEYHLINEKSIDDQYLYNADISGDSVITVTDLSLLLQKVEDKLIYTTEVSNFSASNYVNKGEDYIISFDANVSYGAYIEKVKVNGNYYNINLINDNEYSISFKSGNSAGVKNYKFEEFVLNNGKTIEVDFESKVIVLKSIPEFNNYNVEVDNENSEAKISFNINDIDNAIYESYVGIYDSNNKLIKKYDIKNGYNSFNLSLEDSAKYIAKFNIKYNTVSFDNEENEGILEFSKELQLNLDYDFEFNDLKISKVSYNKNEDIEIIFDTSNKTKYKPSTIIVNGKEYFVKSDNGKYSAIVSGFKKGGANSLTFDSITLENGKKFDINEKITVYVNKDVPIIDDLRLIEDSTIDGVVTGFSINDNEHALSNIKLRLLDENDTILEEIILTDEEINNELGVSKKFDRTFASKFKIQVIGDYSLTGNNSDLKSNVVLAEKEIDAITVVELVNINSDKKYYEKNESIELTYTFKTNKKEDITKITINDKDYDVTDNGGKYKVTLNGYSDYGFKNINTSKVTYSDNESIIINNILDIEVLKDIPTIEIDEIYEDIDKSSLTILFDVTDKDDSISSSVLAITDSNNKVVNSFDITSGFNTFEINVEDGKKYTARFDIKYNLSTDKNNNDKLVLGKILLERELQLNINYEFTIDNFKIYDMNGNEVNTFNKNEDIKLVFNSTNATMHKINKVIINGKEYDVKRENDSYIVIISGLDKYGAFDLNVEKVVLENGKSFDINKKLNINISKEKPEIYDFSISENNKDNTIDVEFSLIDINNSLSNVVVRLYDSKNNIIKDISLSDDEIEMAGRISKSFDAIYTSKYKACIIGTYSLTDNGSDVIKDKVLAEKEFVATPRADIVNVNSDKKYYEKKSNANLTYNIKTNKELDIIAITINDKDYEVIKNSDGSYNVTYEFDNLSGIKPLKATNIIFSDNSYIEVNNTINVEVLRDIPKLIDYKEIDDIDNSQVIVEFTIEDNDFSLVSGNAILTNKNDKTKEVKSIKAGKNRIVFNVKELVSYTFDVSVTYDRDESDDSTNRVSDKVIYTNEIAGIYEYNLKVNNVKVKNKENESKYFNKNESIIVEFESSNASSFVPSKVVINGKTYSVNKNGDAYKAEISDINNYGIQDLNIEKIILSNNKELEVKDKNVTIEILKDKPSIENINLVEDINDPSITISFDVVNSDNAKIDGKVIVVDSNNDIVEEVSLKNGANTIKVVVEDGKKYTAKFEANYNLSLNNDNTDKEVLGSILIDKELQLNIDYKFFISDFKTYSSDNNENTIFKKNEDIKLTFNSTNATTHNISKIIVNGTKYDVSRDKDSYSAILKGFTKYGNNTINIEKVVLDNSKEFNVSKSLNVIVKKDAPEIYDFSIIENSNNNTVDVEFSLIDIENSLTDVSVRLLDGDNKVIEDIKLTADEIEKAGKIAKSFNRIFTSKYNVSIIGTYLLTDNNSDVVKDKVLAESSIIAIARAEIIGSESNKKYYEKSEEGILTYNIKSNRSDDITKITINGKVYDISKNNDGSYNVIYKFDNVCGEKSLEVTNIIFSDNSSVSVKDNLKVEVLKDKPIVNDYKVINDVKNSSIKVEFNIENNDDSFISGNAVLTNKIDGSKESKNIKTGKNSIIFEVNEFDSYKFEIITTYDRDSSTDNGTSLDTFSRDIKPEFDYELILGNIVSINGDNETKYFNKGESITIEFDTSNITSFTPMKAVIDEREYDVTKSGDSYRIVVDGFDSIGVNTLKLEKLILSNNKAINLTNDNTVEVEILKDKPSISNYKVSEDINNSSLTISFDFNDKEDSLVNGEVKIVDEDKKDILKYEINKGSNSIEIPVIEGKKYNVLFNINYNLSSKENNNDKEVVGAISREEMLQLNIDYKFIVSDFVTYSNNIDSTLFNKDEDIKLMFNSTNATNHTISKVVIDGNEYSPSYENDKYSIFLSNINEAGTKIIYIDKIILDNGKEFDVNKNIEVYIRKSIPIVSNLKLSENKDYSINSNFKLVDSDNSLSKIIVRLSDKNNNLIKDIDLTTDEIKNAGNITKIFEDSYKSVYNVSIIGSYSLSNDSNDLFTDIVLGSSSLSATPRAEITNSRIDGDKLYYEKSEDVTLIYNIRTNSDSDITKLTINNKNYDVIKMSDGSYKVIYKLGNDYGVKSLSASKVIYKDNKNASVTNTLSIDILKDAPIISEFKQIEDINTNKAIIEFNIEDCDESFESGEAFLTNKTNNSSIKKKVTIGYNRFEFDIDSNDSYLFSIYLTYDRDSNTLTTGDNRYENDKVKEEALVLNTEYNFTLNDVKTYINQVENKDYSKNQQIQLGFNSSNTNNIDLASIKVNGNIYSDIQKINGRYYVLVDGFNEYGNQKLKLEEAILTNGKYFSIVDNNVSVNILKDEPKVVEVNTAESVIDKKLAVNFNFKDDDKAISSLNIILYDENNEEISRNSVSKDEIKSGWISKELKTSLSEKYRVVIDSVYNIGKDNVYKVLYESEVIADVVFNIKNITLSKEYYYKDENIIIEYEVETNQKAEVSKIYTSNIEHNAVKLSDDEYQIRIDRFTETGVYEINTTKIILSNNMEFNVSEISRFEIIKDIPEIVNKNIIEDQVNSTITYAFDVVDVDSAVKDGKIVVTDFNNKTIGEFAVEKGHNEVSFDAEDGIKYKINTSINYNVFNSKEIINTLTSEEEVQLNMDYKFSFSNLKTYSDDVETRNFNKYELIRLGFDSTNATKFVIDSVKINGKIYAVSRDDNHYYVSVDAYDRFGNYNIVVEEVTLSNNKKITLTENNSVPVRILSKKPSISNFTYTENTSSSRLDVGFRLTDDDDTLSLLDIILLGDNDKEISRNRLTGDELNVFEVSRTLTTAKSNKYKIRIIGTYDTVDDSVTEVLLEEVIEAQLVVSIKNINPNRRYYSKDEAIYLDYEIESNSLANISKITVNGTDYEATRLYNISNSSDLNNTKSDYDIYQIKVDGVSKAGVVNFKTTNVIFDNDTEFDIESSVKVEILKDAPSVSFDNNEEDVQNSKIIHSFNIVDSDNSFISGKAVVTKVSDGSFQEFTVKSGLNILEIPVEYGKEYTASLYVTYDLDTNELTQNDNLYSNEKVSEHGLVLRASYQLAVGNLKTYNETGESSYFSSGEKINVEFDCTNATSFKPVSAVINGKTYDVLDNNGKYRVTIDGFTKNGVQDISIEKIILDNTHEEVIKNNNLIKVEILKSKATVSGYSFEEDDSGDVTVKFKVTDSDSTILKNSGVVYIVEDGSNIKSQSLVIGNNTIVFSPKSGKKYIVKVVADYDLDTNKLGSGFNEYKNAVLYENEISLGNRAFEVKDITKSTVYVQKDTGVEEVSTLNVSDLSNLSKYVVKVETRKMPAFYTTINDYRVDNNRLKLSLDYENVVQYDGSTKQNKLEIDYGSVKDGVVEYITFESILEKMNENPSGTFELTQDYDLSGLNISSTALVTKAFTGKLNGNGHTLSNLNNASIFASFRGTVENLNIKGFSFIGSSNCISAFAQQSYNATYRNMTFDNITLSGQHSVGVVVGIDGVIDNKKTAGSNSVFENISVTNANVAGTGVYISTFVGRSFGGRISNVYAHGSINTSSTENGGIVGSLEENGTIENAIVDVSISKPSNTYTGKAAKDSNGAIVGQLYNNSTVRNSIAFGNMIGYIDGDNGADADGNDVEDNELLPYKFTGATEATIISSFTNCYEVDEEIGFSRVTEATHGKLDSVSRKNLNRQFYLGLGFDESIWNLSGVSESKIPELKISESDNDEDDDVSSGSLYIPGYGRIRKSSSYDKNKDILYHNIYKLMPYYDSKYLIEDGLKISSDNILYSKVIKHILPYSNGKLLSYLSMNNYNSITNIKVVFDDYTIKNYDVTFKNLSGNISIYEIEGLDLEYAYSNYVINSDSEIVNKIVNYIKNLDYAKVLDPLTAAADSRLYKDHYNGVLKANADLIALQLLQNDDSIVLTLNNSVLNNKIEHDLIDNGRLNRLLYSYNYYHRWYQFEIGGARVIDILLFQTGMFKENIRLNSLVNEVFGGSIATNTTANFYAANLSKYTGSSSLQNFLNGLIKNLGEYENVDDWFTEYFSTIGIVKEIPVKNRPDVIYRAWPLLNKKSNYVLPYLTLPKNSGYIISGGIFLQMGAQVTYSIDPTTAQGQKDVNSKLTELAGKIETFVNTLAGTFNTNKWNSINIYMYDSRKYVSGYAYLIPGIPDTKYAKYAVASSGTSQPYFKNFNDAVNVWGKRITSAGYADGANVFFDESNAADFKTWTHELGHDIDDKVMLSGNGIRGSSEDYTDGNVTQHQAWGTEGAYYFNLAYSYGKESLATFNLTPSRIETREKLENYFHGQQQTLDYLDYVEAKAFLLLTPEEQAKIAYRISQSGTTTKWNVVTADEIKAMNLKTVEDLWDNKIILRPDNEAGIGEVKHNNNSPTSQSTQIYGFEKIWVRRWYIQHNDSGRSNAWAFKKNMFEMLGNFGYSGYKIYGSKLGKNDLDALQKITGDSEMTWKKYQMNKYAEMESKWNNANVDSDYLVEKYRDALILDAKNTGRNVTNATNIRKVYYYYLKAMTNDFVNEPIDMNPEVTHIKTAEELITKISAKPYGNYVLDNDLDFTGYTGKVNVTFMGKLDGNGHKIIGNTNAIFQKIRYGSVKNLNFEGTRISRNVTNVGILANNIQFSVIEDIDVVDVVINSSGRNTIGLIGGAISTVSYKNCNVEQLVVNIASAEDFAKINEDAGGLYNIVSDIDFTGYNASGSAVISSTFTGKIEGNGHTISNLNNKTLFTQFNGTVENLNIKNFSNLRPGSDFVTAFADKTNGATLKNMKFEDVALSGVNSVAVVTGRDDSNSTFENISVSNANVTGTGVYVSTFIGRKYAGVIKNVYVQGALTVNSTENGGLVGAVQTAGTITNVITDVSVTKTHNTYSKVDLSIFNASMIGNIYTSPKISNSIAFGNMTGFTNASGVEDRPFKFTGAVESQVIATLTNCYEVDEEIGFSRVSENTAGKLDSISRTKLNKQFYLDLGFDEKIWDLNNLTSKGYPTLKK